MSTVKGSSDIVKSDPHLDRLGRARPESLPGQWSELGFCFAVALSQILAEFYVTGSSVLLPTLIKELEIPASSTIWPATALSLAVTSTLLIFGRLTDMYGGYVVYNGGAILLTVTSILCGVSQSALMLIICRALQGLALGALLPSGLMILGSTYRPGPRKNLVFSIYGACAVLGFFLGFFISGLCGQFLSWRWFFFIGAILSAVMVAFSLFCVRNDYQEKKSAGVRMDWVGLALSVSGATLVVFALAYGSHAPQGWKTPYIPILFAIGVVLLCLMAYFEGWVVSNPLLPGDIFQVKSMTPMLLALLCLYGSMGIFLIFGVLYMSAFMGASPLQIVAWTAPMAVGGLFLSITGGLVLHKLSGTLLMIISCCGYVGCALLFALVPLGGNYWAFIFPAMICATIAVDICFSLANVFVTTSLPQARQGLAGALIYCTLHMGIAVVLGFADIIESQTKHLGQWKSYKSVFWFQVGLSVVGLLIILGF
ncbi:hypothetical protein N7539_008261, partial [Penicillium diatomitis]